MKKVEVKILRFAGNSRYLSEDEERELNSLLEKGFSVRQMQVISMGQYNNNWGIALLLERKIKTEPEKPNIAIGNAKKWNAIDRFRVKENMKQLIYQMTPDEKEKLKQQLFG